MNARSRFDIALVAWMLLMLALFLPKLVLADSALYRDILTERTLLVVGGVTKITALAIGAVCAARIMRSFAIGDEMRNGWGLATLWFSSWTLAQGILGIYQIILGRSAPFPSAGDAFFVIGYPAMIGAFLVFIRAYASTGLLGPLRAHLPFVGVTGVLLLGALVVVLRPVVAGGGPPLELALNVAYPAFDAIALVPTLVLARIALRMSGGSLFFVWARLCAGIVFMAVGDLLYSWFSSLDYTTLDPLLDVSYLFGYGLAARGVYQQFRLSVAVPDAATRGAP